MEGRGHAGVIRSRNLQLILFFPFGIASLRQHLNRQGEDEDHFDFDFVNGPFPSTPAAGIELFYQPPYYCFWDTQHTLDDIARGRAWLLEYVAANGPYDGVMMFSQGCTLGSSTLLHHNKESPTSPPPFKFAIFICGGPSLKELDQRLDFTVLPEAWQLDEVSRTALQQRAVTAAILAQGGDRWQNDVRDLTTLSDEELARQITGRYQIDIPTVHIVGAKDPRYFAGLQLFNLSHPDVRKTFDHDGGHEIPRNERTSTTIASLIRWVSSPLVASRLKQNSS
jgi:hypothetical protein